MNKPCSIDGCPRQAVSRGFCNKHYQSEYYIPLKKMYPVARVSGVQLPNYLVQSSDIDLISGQDLTDLVLQFVFVYRPDGRGGWIDSSGSRGLDLGYHRMPEWIWSIIDLVKNFHGQAAWNRFDLLMDKVHLHQLSREKAATFVCRSALKAVLFA